MFIKGGLREGLRGGDPAGDRTLDSKELVEYVGIMGAGLGFSYRGGDPEEAIRGNEEYGIEEGRGREFDETRPLPGRRGGGEPQSLPSLESLREESASVPDWAVDCCKGC